jgi:hypothetical protein
MEPAADVSTSVDVSTVVLAGLARRASPRLAVTVTRSVIDAGTSTTRVSPLTRGVTT